MLETELFALLEQTADAAYTVTDTGEVCSWNGAAERLFGYPLSEVLSRNIDEVLEARDALGTRTLTNGAGATTHHCDATASLIPDFDLEVRSRLGGRIWVNISTIVFNNWRTGRQLFVCLARDISPRRRNEDLINGMLEVAQQFVSLAHNAPRHAPIALLSEQERRILQLFAQGINSASIAQRLGIAAQTLRNHLHHINQKLRTHSRLEAVIHAQQRGIID